MAKQKASQLSWGAFAYQMPIILTSIAYKTLWRGLVRMVIFGLGLQREGVMITGVADMITGRIAMMSVAAADSRRRSFHFVAPSFREPMPPLAISL